MKNILDNDKFVVNLLVGMMVVGFFVMLLF
jgi:hypothetical protein